MSATTARCRPRRSRSAAQRRSCTSPPATALGTDGVTTTSAVVARRRSGSASAGSGVGVSAGSAAACRSSPCPRRPRGGRRRPSGRRRVGLGAPATCCGVAGARRLAVADAPSDDRRATSSDQRDAEHEQPRAPVDRGRQRSARSVGRHGRHASQRPRPRPAEPHRRRSIAPTIGRDERTSTTPVLRVVRRRTRATCRGAARRVAVVGDGLGVHAAADAGRPGAAGARGVARALADARPTWPPSRPARRCGPGAGSATRAARCGCTPPPSRSSSEHGGEVPAAYDDLLRPARRRRLHRGRDRDASPTAGATSCSTPTCAGCSPAPSTGVEFPAASVTRAERDVAAGAAARRRRRPPRPGRSR